jgi:hypothetical protein
MAPTRHEHHPTCRFHQAGASCVALAVGRLSQERIYELAEEIWTASGTGRRNRWRRVWVVLIIAIGSGLVVGLTAGAGLGGRMAVVAAWAAGGADLLLGRHGETPAVGKYRRSGWGTCRSAEEP